MATGWRGPSAADGYYVCNVNYDGNMIYYGFYNTNRAVRPVVSIPKSDITMELLGLK